MIGVMQISQMARRSVKDRAGRERRDNAVDSCVAALRTDGLARLLDGWGEQSTWVTGEPQMKWRPDC